VGWGRSAIEQSEERNRLLSCLLLKERREGDGDGRI